jgi:hypothetical protein
VRASLSKKSKDFSKKDNRVLDSLIGMGSSVAESEIQLPISVSHRSQKKVRKNVKRSTVESAEQIHRTKLISTSRRKKHEQQQGTDTLPGADTHLLICRSCNSDTNWYCCWCNQCVWCCDSCSSCGCCNGTCSCINVPPCNDYDDYDDGDYGNYDNDDDYDTDDCEEDGAYYAQMVRLAAQTHIPLRMLLPTYYGNDTTSSEGSN